MNLAISYFPRHSSPHLLFLIASGELGAAMFADRGGPDRV
jgi:hypothetical protein